MGFVKFILLCLVLPTCVFAKVHVVATFTVLGDMVKVIGGEHVQVHTIVGPNADVHVYEPSPKVAKEILKSDLLISNGLNMEPWLSRLLKASGFKGPHWVATFGMSPNMLPGNVPDPHGWHDPDNGVIYIENIKNALIEQDPTHSKIYEARAKEYQKRLMTLKGEIIKILETPPGVPRIIITTHDAFGYMEKPYKLEFSAPLGISTDSEVSAKVMGALVQDIRKRGIKAIFLENSTNPKIVEQLARESQQQVDGTLYADSLSAPGTEGDTYLKMLETNARKISKALKGS